MAAAAIGIINALLPMEWVNMKLFKVADAPYDKLTYDQAEPSFETDYPRENPATAQEAREKFENRMRNKAF